RASSICSFLRRRSAAPELFAGLVVFAASAAVASRTGITGGRKSRTEGSSTCAAARASFFCALSSFPPRLRLQQRIAPAPATDPDLAHPCAADYALQPLAGEPAIQARSVRLPLPVPHCLLAVLRRPLLALHDRPLNLMFVLGFASRGRNGWSSLNRQSASSPERIVNRLPTRSITTYLPSIR